MTSKVTFAATAGVTYEIAVNGFATTSGPFTGNVSLAASEVASPTVDPPANDKFANARWISGRSVTITASNVNATRETGEPKIYGNAGGKSVWFNWTATGTGATHDHPGRQHLQHAPGRLQGLIRRRPDPRLLQQ